MKDYFTPCNAIFLNAIDMDLGSSGPVLIPGANVIFGGGKDGHLYLLSTASMGKHAAPAQPNAETCPNPNALQDVAKAALGHLHGSPVFWEGPDGARVFVWGENDRLRAYRFVNRRIVQEAQAQRVPRRPTACPAGCCALSSQGKANGILWAVVPLTATPTSSAASRASCSPSTRGTSRRRSGRASSPARATGSGSSPSSSPPTIADGKVFVATYGDDEPLRQYGGQTRPQMFPQRYQVAVYGMLAEPPAPVVNQSRDDVQLVTATVEGAVTIDPSRCRPATGAVLDCTQELERAAGAPSLERIAVPEGFTFAGCQLLRVTTASQDRRRSLPRSASGSTRRT